MCKGIPAEAGTNDLARSPRRTNTQRQTRFRRRGVLAALVKCAPTAIKLGDSPPRNPSCRNVIRKTKPGRGICFDPSVRVRIGTNKNSEKKKVEDFLAFLSDLRTHTQKPALRCAGRELRSTVLSQRAKEILRAGFLSFETVTYVAS